MGRDRAELRFYIDNELRNYTMSFDEGKKMEAVYYIYRFEDGTILTLVNTGFSIAEGSKMRELHGDCKLEIKQVRI